LLCSMASATFPYCVEHEHFSRGVPNEEGEASLLNRVSAKWEESVDTWRKRYEENGRRRESWRTPLGHHENKLMNLQRAYDIFKLTPMHCIAVSCDSHLLACILFEINEAKEVLLIHFAAVFHDGCGHRSLAKLLRYCQANFALGNPRRLYFVAEQQPENRLLMTSAVQMLMEETWARIQKGCTESEDLM